MILIINILWWSAGSHYKTFSSRLYFQKWLSDLSYTDGDKSNLHVKMIENALNAKHPFQFLSHLVHMDTPIMDRISMIPVSLDAF
jgi:hypothetical protein